ncbi:MAG: sulfatase-like hydrolase/transferase, partial [Bacteroidota bacterium]
ENGIETPNINRLAEQGLIFNHAFSNGPVCSVARSTIITGCYAPRIGAQYHRKYVSVPMPDSLKMFPAYLREAGYYTTNNSKKDYNIIESPNIWDESSGKATWRKRSENQPFFHVVNIGITHESRLHFSKEEMDSISTVRDVAKYDIQPNHPNTKTFEFTNAYYRGKIQEMDQRVGKILNELEKDSLMDDTFIFYYGDHGGVLPGSKGYVFETGLHIPLVVYVPKNYRHLVNGASTGRVNGFVSFIDLGPTVLNLAGIKTPEGMDGRAFLGAGEVVKEMAANDKAFGYADRFDEKYDLVRSVRKGNYKYIRNFQPFNFDGLMNNYRYKQLAYKEWQELYEKGDLNDAQAAFFRAKEPEALYDLSTDPFETVNLAKNEAQSAVLTDMRKELDTWIKQMPDLSFYPEHYLIDSAFANPTAFGQTHQQEISNYVDVANLSLAPFDQVKDQLIQSLGASDSWERYWALISATALGEKPDELVSLITTIAEEDPELLNRARAAEFLAIVLEVN